jgi:hypothetical protein
MDPSTPIPEFRPWSIAAVRLLQGVVYADEEAAWDAVLGHRSPLEEYFGRLGLGLHVDETEGFAFLQQLDEEELPEGYEKLPRLFRRTQLSYASTLLCVLLRDELRRFDEEELEHQRCVVETHALLADWQSFFPAEHDEVKQFKELSAALRKLEEMRFVRRFSDDPEAWEIRRILKARVPAAELEQLRGQLLAATQRRGSAARSSDV